ncbi:hypothetical protein BH23BAC1_BH23BAC1_35580 [soil metagenome]
MKARNEQVDGYINRSADFAKPILNHIRELIHSAWPKVTETIKWGFPHFEYKGLMCSMASFKNHCAFTFTKAILMTDPNQLFSNIGKTAMGHFGQIKSLKDLPPDDILKNYIREAAKLNEEGAKLPPKSKSAERELNIPDYFLEALNQNHKAKETFGNFSYTNKKEYIDWVVGAKSEETRNKRISTALEWMAEGKIKNWKYVK